MQTVLTCPATKEEIVFDLPCDDATLNRLWGRAVGIECPQCNKVHEIGFRDVYVAGVASQFTCLPIEFKDGRLH